MSDPPTLQTGELRRLPRSPAHRAGPVPRHRRLQVGGRRSGRTDPRRRRAVGRRGRAVDLGRVAGGGRRAGRGRLAVLPGSCASATSPSEPTLVLVSGSRLDELSTRDDLFDDFIIMPFLPQELEARLQHLQWRAGRGVRPELIVYGPLSLNVETYQAMLENRPLDLTYMEYELLRFLAASPGQVFTREVLLNLGLGLRVLRRGPHRRRPHPAPAGPDGRGALQPDLDRAGRRLQAGPVPLAGQLSPERRRAGRPG